MYIAFTGALPASAIPAGCRDRRAWVADAIAPALQVERAVSEPVRSGVVNAGNAFELRATATAQDSTYAGIVWLAQRAGADSAPIVRLADRYAAWFLLIVGAARLASGSAVRAVAVLVVATPCLLGDAEV
jgi:cation transport ATPase